MLKKIKALFGAQDMTVGSPFICLLKFAVPLLIGNIAQLMYTSVDAVIVGKYLGDTALSAIGAAMPPYNLFLVLFIGIGAGVTIMVAQYFGAKEYDNLGLSIGNSITLIAFASVFITAFAVPFTPTLLTLVKTPAETFDIARAYLMILFAGAVGNGFYNVLSGILRGLGESIFPLLVLLGTVILNVGLDIFFVAGLSMGAEGAAIATIIAQLLSSAVCLVKIMTMRDVVKIRMPMLKLRRRIVAQIVRLGVPNAISMGIMFASTLVVQSVVNKMGYMVLTAMTVTVRLDGFAILPSQTFSIAASTFTGQNIGAGNMDRVKQGSKTVFLMCLVFTAVMVAAMNLFGRNLMELFTKTESVIVMGMTFIRILTPAYFVLVINQCLSGVMRGAGDPMGPMWISMAVNLFLRIPVAHLIAYFTRSEINPNGSPNTLPLTILISMTTFSIITIIYYRAGRWRNKSIVGRKDEEIPAAADATA